MAYEVVIPQDITELGKKFLRDKGYKIRVGNGNMDTEYLKRLIINADAILARTGFYPREVLASAKNLKVIGRHGVGYDNLDLEYCKENNITITYTPSALSNAVAERTIGFIMALGQQLVFIDAETRTGNWEVRNTHRGNEAKNKVLGLIGLGRIGSLVAKKAYFGLDMKVVAYDKYASKKAFPKYINRLYSAEEVFEKADFVSLHVPSTSETNGIVNKRTLEIMKPSAYIINCSRGELIDEVDLIKAIQNKRIRGAALDVFNEEPLPDHHPFFELDNILLTPHNSALTNETMDIIGLHAAQGIDDVLSNRKPTWPVKL